MATRGTNTRPPATATATDLARLIATERRLEQRLAEARAEGARVVAAAQHAAETAEAGLVAGIEAEARALQEREAAERREALARIEDEGRMQANAYATVPDDTVAALARAVVVRMVQT